MGLKIVDRRPELAFFTELADLLKRHDAAIFSDSDDTPLWVEIAGREEFEVPSLLDAPMSAILAVEQ